MKNKQQLFNKAQYLTVLSQNSHCTLKEDSRVEQQVQKNIQLEYSKQREGIHATDLTLCLRQSLFKKLKPLDLTTRQIGFFFDGSRRHESLQKMYGSGIAENEVEFEGIRCTVDILDNGTPIEFKTSRARNAISSHWIAQLALYMLAVNSSRGILQIQRIMPGKGENAKDENPFPSYVLELNEEQKAKWLEYFIERKESFARAYLSSDPAKAPIYRGDGNWLCQECAYRAECDKIEGFSK